ncbi:sulfurtransferase [Nitrococcus mobilis]|uniref:Sulfurtransferase n=1 Tax=Nitrococcus mobilis Nb-231 TaxID=314278 RepID=A4BVC1_9GAMM|nr:sulfurtransferase [Nitrococcus mobilis]EAR20306.1 Thiosulfate sulfurtransferase [Nitrococcus mobilis Nb-231]
MTDHLLPLLVEPEELERHLANPRLLLIDLSSPQTDNIGHIPGAVQLDYSALVRGEPPAVGRLPDEAHLTELFSALGLTEERHVVAYDDERNARASRLLWTLDVLGHFSYSLLNGGLRAWRAEQRPLESTPRAPVPSTYRAKLRNPAARADRDYILQHLDDAHTLVLDVRSPAEYRGEELRSLRGGHIPGAVNFEWTQAIDPENHLRLRPPAELREQLNERGITPDKAIITHCQSHQRSAHTFIVLKSLGYPQVRGYDGSWSEWGNDADLPIEVD